MAVLHALDAAIDGSVTRPDEIDWDDARSAWNLAVPQAPVAIVALRNAADAAATVRHAAAEGLAVTVQPRGHGATRGTADGAVLVRTAALHDISIDVDRRVARVGAGVRWGDLNAKLDGTGLIGLAGTSPGVSVAGYLLGGGLSWFSRTYGFASSSVRAVELVTPDGEQVRVTAESDPELFWALRGAGGEFGIVTAIEIGLFPHPSFVGGQLLFPGDSARDVFAAFADLTADAPDALSVIASVLHYPPLPFIPEPVRGKSVAALTMAYLGAENDLAKLIGPARAAGPLIDDRISTLTISRLGEVAAEPTEPAPFVDYATLARRFNHDTAGRLLDVVGNRETTPLLAASVRHLGGAFTTAPDQPGLAAAIDHPYVLSAIGIAPDPAAIPALEAASAAILPALGEDGVDRAPFTFLGERPITDAYATADITRLRTLKQARDPRNVIRSNHPVL